VSDVFWPRWSARDGWMAEEQGMGDVLIHAVNVREREGKGRGLLSRKCPVVITLPSRRRELVGWAS